MNQGILDKIFLKIKWLRTQPEDVKIRYIWIFSIVVLAVVILLWAAVFRKYERKIENKGKNVELIEAGEKIKKDIKDKIKVLNIELPPIGTPMISPEIFPEFSPESLK